MTTHIQNNVEFGYSKTFKKWFFKSIPLNHTILLSLAGVPDKKEIAAKVANIIAGAAKRGKVDGLARANINKLLDPAM